VGTAETVKAILTATPSPPGNATSRSCAVLSNYELLDDGIALVDLVQPDRMLIGGDDPAVI
jgi:UDPglucose 6-dehydrogenase